MLDEYVRTLKKDPINYEQYCSIKRDPFHEEQEKIFNQLQKLRDEKQAQWEYDYETIITSPAFRRLQDKTQVFPLERNDFVHTRLTHTLEVVMVMKNIIEQLDAVIYQPSKDSISEIDKIKTNCKGEELDKKIKECLQKIPNDRQDYKKKILKAAYPLKNFFTQKESIIKILENACLIHDIGNPPFGHIGENIIRQWFNKYFSIQNNEFPKEYQNDFINFEGNAQALRVISKLHNNSDGNMHLTYAVISCILKYTVDSNNVGINSKVLTSKKLGYFTSEKALFDKVQSEMKTNCKRNPLTYILEAADDIAYIIADIEDAIKKNVISFKDVKEYVKNTLENNYNKSDKDILIRRLDSLSNKEDYFRYIRTYLISGARFGFSYNQELVISSSVNPLLEMLAVDAKVLFEHLKKFCKDNIYSDKNILRKEIAARNILNFLLDTFVPAAICAELDEAGKQLVIKDQNKQMEQKLLALIPSTCKAACVRALNNEEETKDDDDKLYYKLLMVTDFISGMTDSYAHNLYLELSGNKL